MPDRRVGKQGITQKGCVPNIVPHSCAKARTARPTFAFATSLIRQFRQAPHAINDATTYDIHATFGARPLQLPCALAAKSN